MAERLGTCGGASGRAGRLLAAGLLAAALAAAGCALGGEPRAPEDDARARSGEALFRRHCASCHGLRGRGDGPVANRLREEPADLTRVAARRGGAFPEAEILRIIDGRDPVVAHGTREMPVWGDRFGAGLEGGPGAEAARRGPAWLLIEYLKTIQRPAEPSDARGSAGAPGAPRG